MKLKKDLELASLILLCNSLKKRVTINLSPADIPKDSTSIDLAMAVSVLAESRQIEKDRLQ